MASMDDADILHPTPERLNFYRLTTLLIVGGTEIMRQEFDRIHPPRTLATVLARVASTIQRSARLTRTQMDSLYPPTGAAVRSRDFDITLLFALLRNICHLPAPATGWDVLPHDLDESLEADLARIKYYRNELYAHVSGGMEISDDQFNQLWGDISRALLRIVGKNDAPKMMYWRGHMNTFYSEPLDQSPESLVLQLKEWREAEREEMRQLNRSVSDLVQGTEALNISLQDNTKKMMEEHCKTRLSVEKDLETIQDTFLQLATKETAGSEAASGVNAAQVGAFQYGGLIVNNHYNFTYTNKRQPTASSPQHAANELPGAPFARQLWNTETASPPAKPCTDSPGIPFSRHSSGFDSEENFHEGETSFPSSEFSANSWLSPTYFEGGPQSNPSPAHPWSWSADDTSTSVSNVPKYDTRSSTPVSSVSPLMPPRSNPEGHGMFSYTSQSPALQGHGPTSSGARPRTAPYNLVSSVSPPIPTRYDPAGHGIFPLTSQSPASQEHGPTSSGARPRIAPYNPVGSVSPPILTQSDPAGHGIFPLTSQSPASQEHGPTSSGARPRIALYNPASSASPSIPTRFDAAGHGIFSVTSQTPASQEPSVLSNFGRSCSARSDSIPHATEEFGRGYLSIVIRCCIPDRPLSSAVIDRIANASIRPSTESAHGSQSQFQRYLEDNKCLRVMHCQAAGNQCTILVQPLLLSGLDELWKEYKAGDLRVIVQTSLATPEVLQNITDHASLQVEIDEEQYKLCNLMMGSEDQTQRLRTSSFNRGTPVAPPPPSRPKSMPDFTTESCRTSAARQLYNIICENGGSMELWDALRQLKQLSEDSYATIFALGEQNVLRKHDDLFCMMPNGKMVNAVLPVKFCKTNGNPGGCTSRCPDLHLCPFHLLGNCERTSSDCIRSHDPSDQHTLRILGNRCGLGHLTTRQRLCLLQKLASDKQSEWKPPRNTVPKVCIFYVKGPCRNDDKCAYLHVCGYWVQGRDCRYADRCIKGHNFESQHNRGILERDGMHGLRDWEVLELLQRGIQH